MPLRRLLRRARATAIRVGGMARRRRSRLPWDERARSITPRQLDRDPATKRLYDRLERSDLEAVEAMLTPGEREVIAGAGEADRRRVLLAFAVHHETAGALAHTGLSAATPPDEVHAMGRGALAAGGSYYYADLVADAISHAGAELAAGARALDFGCSSGRAVRVLAAAYPDVSWHGCDPNAGAIQWASAELPGIEFSISPQEPPLPYPADHFSLVFAISIWSHLAASAAVRWLAEMARILVPGGTLALTTHGYQSVALARQRGIRSSEQAAEILAAMYRDGHWYKPEFGEAGDHGVASPDWGNAFCTSEWLLAATGEAWRLEHFAPGIVEGDQDLYVLSRR